MGDGIFFRPFLSNRLKILLLMKVYTCKKAKKKNDILINTVFSIYSFFL